MHAGERGVGGCIALTLVPLRRLHCPAGGVVQSLAPLLRTSSDQQRCEAFISFLFLTVGLVAPLALLLKTEPQASLVAFKAWQAGAARRGCLARAAIQCEGGIRTLCGRSWLAAVLERQGGDDADKSCLHDLQRAAAWWLLLSLLWAAPVAAYGL